MKKLLAGLMILAAAAVFLVSHCVQGDAQNVQVGGEPQQRNTQISTTKTMEIGTDGKPSEKVVSTNTNLPIERTNAKGKLVYSGIPGQWMREKEAVGGQMSK